MLCVGRGKCVRLCYMRLKTGEASINNVRDYDTVKAKAKKS